MNEEQEYSMDDLRKDIEHLTKLNLIDAVGITDEGEWLYSLTPEAKAKVDNAEEIDIWCVLDRLIRESEEEHTEEE